MKSATLLRAGLCVVKGAQQRSGQAHSGSGSFAFSRAAPTTVAQQAADSLLQQPTADVHPLGFFAPDGGVALHRRSGQPPAFCASLMTLDLCARCQQPTHHKTWPSMRWVCA